MRNILLLSLSVVALLGTSCAEDLSSKIDQKRQEAAVKCFDFATTKNVKVNIDYGNVGYPIMFKVYGENPYMVEDGQVVANPELEPIVTAFTASDGSFSESINIPTSVENVYVYSSYLGATSLMKAQWDGAANALSLNASDNAVDPNDEVSVPSLAVKSRAAVTYLSPFTWNNYGRVNELLTIDAVSAATLSSINKALAEKKDNSAYAMSTDFYISEDAEIIMRYVDGTTAARSTFGYYCYKGVTPPANATDLLRVCAFPNANKSYASIKNNDAVQLKFYDEATGEWKTTFPKGYTLGFFVVNNGGKNFANGNPDFLNDKTFYSTTSLNSDNRTHTAAFDIKDGDKTIRVLSFEDWTTDNDYNDVIFSLQANPITALGPVPEVDPTETETVVSTTTHGIMAFEDLWPYKGDFDLNDVVVRYSCKVYVGEKDGKVIKTEDTYTLLWSGADLHDAFCYEMNVPASNIESTVTGDYTFSGQGLQTNSSSKAIFKVFDSCNTIVSNNASDTKTVTITNVFKERVSLSDLSAPYNPFIIPGINQGRTREVHLVDYAPTALADTRYLGKWDDLSAPALGLYYRATGNYPFAILMPNLVDLGDFLSGKYETIEIGTAFPRYKGWVESNGTSSKDWYLYPAAE